MFNQNSIKVKQQEEKVKQNQWKCTIIYLKFHTLHCFQHTIGIKSSVGNQQIAEYAVISDVDTGTMKRRLILFLFLMIISFGMYSQRMYKRPCLHPTIVELHPTENKTMAVDGTLEYDHKDRLLVQYFNDKTASKWYRFDAFYDCTFSFKIWPADPTSGYGFFVYKASDSAFFCRELAHRQVTTERSSIYKHEIGTGGIGLDPILDQNLDDTITYSRANLLYHLPYQNALEVKSGESIYVNVYRYAGGDCGHIVEWKANELTLPMRCTYESCMVTPMRRIDAPIFFDSTEIKLERMLVEMNRPKPFLIQLNVTDSLDASPIAAELTNLYRIRVGACNTEGQYSMATRQDTAFVISAMGYHSKTVSFIRDSLETAKIQLRKISSGEKFELEHIYFRTNSADIMAKSKKEVRHLADFLKNNPEYLIEIQGHTNGRSRIKKDAYYKGQFHGNEMKLSKYRARAVKEELIEEGIDKKRIKVRGMGGEQMIFPNPRNDYEKDRNKRVEVVIL